MTGKDFRIEVLGGSYDAFGMVLDLLSRHPPFADSPLDQLAKTLRKQLRQGRNVAALSLKDDLVAYAGWVPALRASAELWVEGKGPLEIVEKGSDALDEPGSRIAPCLSRWSGPCALC